MAINEPNSQIVAQLNDYPVNKFNRLFPTTLTQISPLHKVMVNVVSIDPDENNGDVYKQKSGGGLSLTKTACLKLMTASNVIMEDSRPILPKACHRCVQIAQMTKTAPQCGNCSTKEDAAYQVSILVPEPSGGHRRYIATKEVSKDQFVTKNGGPNKAPVEHMAAQCETKALLRALRAGLGIKGAYSRQELSKPFAVALVVLNTTDPELKKALIQRYAAGQDALFGGPGVPQLSQPEMPALPGATTNGVVVSGYDDEELQPQDGSNDEIIDAESQVIDEEEPPWMNEGQEGNQGDNKFDNAVICEGCDLIIEGQGSWTPEKIKEYTMKQFGQVLCPGCQKKARAAQKGA